MGLKKVLLLHCVVEILGGIVLVINPSFMKLVEMDSSSASLVKLLGVAAIAIGIISVLVYKEFSYNKFTKLFLLAMMGYHMIQSFQTYGMHSQSMLESIAPLAVHGIMTVLFMVFYFMELDKFETENNE